MKSIILPAAVGAAFLLPATGEAAPVCLPRGELAVHLAEEYGETLIAQGLDNRGALVEIYATRDRDRWTLAETDATGRSCLRAAGEYWNALTVREPRAARQPAAVLQSDEQGGEHE